MITESMERGARGTVRPVARDRCQSSATPRRITCPVLNLLASKDGMVPPEQSEPFNDLVGSTDRETIEPKFLGAVADELRTFGPFAGGKNNHQTWFNGALAMVGAVTGQAEFLQAALAGAHGLRWQLANSVTTDGIWYEGTTLQTYTVRAWHEVP